MQGRDGGRERRSPYLSPGYCLNETTERVRVPSGALALVFVLGPLVLLALVALAAYRFFGRRRGR